MDEFCPEYIAIGYGGGGEVLIMKQERDTYTLIVSSGGALLTQFISPEYCTFFNDFFVLLAAPIGWLYDYWAGTGTEQGQWPNEDVRQFQRKADIETFFLSSTPA